MSFLCAITSSTLSKVLCAPGSNFILRIVYIRGSFANKSVCFGSARGDRCTEPREPGARPTRATAPAEAAVAGCPPATGSRQVWQSLDKFRRQQACYGAGSDTILFSFFVGRSQYSGFCGDSYAPDARFAVVSASFVSAAFHSSIIASCTGFT